MILSLTGFSSLILITAMSLIETSPYQVASRISNQDSSGKSITVITRKEIERDGATTVFEILRNFHGIHFVQQGAFGGVTELYMRGTKNGNTLVLIDGVKVNDPSSPDRSYDWGTLPATIVEKIEIIRGPQSALYGNDAVSGVVNIITRTGMQAQKLEASLSVGSFYSFEEQIRLSGKKEPLVYSVALFNASSRGISKAIVENGPAERDGYTNTGIQNSLSMNFNNITTGLSGMVKKARIDMDGGPFKDDPDAEKEITFAHGNMFFKHKLTDTWNYKLAIGLSKTERKESNEKDSLELLTLHKGEFIKGEWQNKLTFNQYLKGAAGIEYTEERAESHCDCGDFTSIITPKTMANYGFYVEVEPKYRNIALRFNGRHDYYGDRGNYESWQSSVLWSINSTQFAISGGTGFKVPTIYKLFSPDSGNLKLNAEKILGYDVKGRHTFESGFVELTYFNNKIEKMIEIENGKYINRKGRWYSEGMELNLLLYITEKWRMDIQYTGIDKVKGEEDYLKVPAHNYRWGINYGWLNLKFCCIGKRFDEEGTFLQALTPLKACRKIDLTTRFKLKKINLETKIENLINEQYMEKFGYNAPGRSFYLGLSI